jgi:hypothetical protein
VCTVLSRIVVNLRLRVFRAQQHHHHTCNADHIITATTDHNHHSCSTRNSPADTCNPHRAETQRARQILVPNSISHPAAAARAWVSCTQAQHKHPQQQHLQGHRSPLNSCPPSTPPAALPSHARHTHWQPCKACSPHTTFQQDKEGGAHLQYAGSPTTPCAVPVMQAFHAADHSSQHGLRVYANGPAAAQGFGPLATQGFGPCLNADAHSCQHLLQLAALVGSNGVCRRRG